jgi:hypothetical protein
MTGVTNLEEWKRAREEELAGLIASQEHGDEPLNFSDAMCNAQHRGLGNNPDIADGAYDPLGFDETTGTDTAMQSQHIGGMLAAGYALMEFDE